MVAAANELRPPSFLLCFASFTIHPKVAAPTRIKLASELNFMMMMWPQNRTLSAPILKFERRVTGAGRFLSI